MKDQKWVKEKNSLVYNLKTQLELPKHLTVILIEEGMRREERRRKVHDALLNMLYPPPPSPPHPPSQEYEDKPPVNALRDGLNVDHFSDEFEDRSTSSSSNGDDDDEGDCGNQKLTRAQRKRLRRKKLKEATSRRRKVIGPLLPTESDEESDTDGNKRGCSTSGELRTEPQGVRYNANEKSDAKIDNSGEASHSGSQVKVKHRRIAKRMARERLNYSIVENSHQNSGP